MLKRIWQIFWLRLVAKHYFIEINEKTFSVANLKLKDCFQDNNY